MSTWTVWTPAAMDPIEVEAALWEITPSGALVFVDADLRPVAAFSAWAWARIELEPDPADVPGDVEPAVSGAV